jgi:putative ABC transport system permease protein
LALFAAGVIMANTVSLSTLERRRQIGIMKALGLQAESALGLLLLENGLVGLVGGLLGTGLSAIALSLSGALGQGRIPLGALGLLILLAVGLTLGATLLTAYGASREKPLNVLRYE